MMMPAAIRTVALSAISTSSLQERRHPHYVEGTSEGPSSEAQPF